MLTAQNAWLTGSALSKAHARPKNLQIIVQTVQTGYKPGYKPALKPVQTVQTGNLGKAYLDLTPLNYRFVQFVQVLKPVCSPVCIWFVQFVR